MNKYCQCPLCYSLYSISSEKEIKKHIKKNKNYYEVMRKYQLDVFFDNFITIDLFRYCHYCGTKSEDFIEMVDPFSSPLNYVSPILLEKKLTDV